MELLIFFVTNYCLSVHGSDMPNLSACGGCA